MLQMHATDVTTVGIMQISIHGVPANREFAANLRGMFYAMFPS